MNHLILPKANRTRLEFEEKYYRETMAVSNYHAEYPGEQIVYFSTFYSDENTLNDLVIEQWKDNKMLRFTKARLATNLPGTNNWTLTDYYEREVSYPNDRITEGHKKDTLFQFKIDEMTQRENFVQGMDYHALKKFIEREKQKGSSKVPMYEIEFYQRTSYPFAVYVLTIIGVAVSSRKKRGGIGVNIAIGLLIIFVYIFAMKVTTVAAMNVGFPASIAVWVPNVLFGGIAYFLYRVAQK
jgi:lipopolysaccharide export system permease protein